MPEINRERDQIWITRNHLLALGVATTCIALLAFFLGLKLGRAHGGPDEEARPPSLTADPMGQEELEAVLRKAARAQPENDFSFPKELPADAVTPPGSEITDPGSASSTSAAPPTEQPELSAEAPVGAVPNGGWSVQVGSYASPEEADQRITELKEQELKPYRVAALVDGQNSWRVRIGGYSSQKAAEEGVETLRGKLGVTALSVVPAP